MSSLSLRIHLYALARGFRSTEEMLTKTGPDVVRCYCLWVARKKRQWQQVLGLSLGSELNPEQDCAFDDWLRRQPKEAP